MWLLKWRFHHVFMEQAGGEGGSGGGGAPSSSADGGTPGGGDPSGMPAGEGKSLLETGAKPSGDANTEFMPEKYRVTKEDGTFDLEASSRKLAEAHSHAEKRIGAGDIPPKAAEEYAVTVPDAFKETFKPEEDQGFKDFRAKALAVGMTQKQMDVVMGQYFEMAPQLVKGAAVLDAQAAQTELQKVWSTEASMNQNVRNAYVATEVIAGKAGLSVDEIMASPLGNDPKFLRLMAVLGPELREDNNPNGEALLGSADEINDLMNSEAYTNRNHKDHAKVSERVRNYFAKKHGNEAAA